MANSKSELHNELQKKLRENPTCRYYDLLPKQGQYKAMLIIGKAQYEGVSSWSLPQARENAAAQALLYVRALDEENLRQVIGLPHRNHIRELDGMRDCLRLLKRRYKNLLGRENSEEAFALIGKLYQEVDKAEANLIIRLGLHD